MFSISTLLVLTITLSSANAQVFRHRRPSLGRIIAGCIIGGLALILFIVGLTCMMRRRRSARAMSSHYGQSGQPQLPYSTGWFGGPYQGHQSAPPPPPPHYGGPGPGPMHHDAHGQSEQYGTDGSRYPMYPPLYANDGNSPYNQFSHQPPGAPPQAHTKGEDYFTGGLRK